MKWNFLMSRPLVVLVGIASDTKGIDEERSYLTVQLDQVKEMVLA